MADHRDICGWIETRKGRDGEASTVWTANGIAQAPKNAIELTAAMTRAVLKP